MIKRVRDEKVRRPVARGGWGGRPYKCLGTHASCTNNPHHSPSATPMPPTAFPGEELPPGWASGKRGGGVAHGRHFGGGVCTHITPFTASLGEQRHKSFAVAHSHSLVYWCPVMLACTIKVRSLPLKLLLRPSLPAMALDWNLKVQRSH